MRLTRRVIVVTRSVLRGTLDLWRREEEEEKKKAASFFLRGYSTLRLVCFKKKQRCWMFVVLLIGPAGSKRPKVILPSSGNEAVWTIDASWHEEGTSEPAIL